MWNMMKRAVIGVVLGALAISVSGCATTQAAEKEKPAKVSKAKKERGSDREQKTAESIPPKAKTMYGMCRILRAQGKTEQAEIALVGLMSEFPEFSPTYNDLAEIELNKGHLDEALNYLDKGLEIAPTDAVLQNNAGVCALLKHDYSTALEHFQAASAIAPYEARYKANVALATGLAGDPETSKELYKDIISAESAEHNTELIKKLLAPQDIAPPTD